MKPDHEIQLVLDTLKKVIKAKGLTYRHLGKELGVSEPTIKRFFTDSDLSLLRLGRICEIVGIELEQLVSTALRRSTPNYRLTEEQEEVLASNPGLFGLYEKLSSGLSPALIERMYGIGGMNMRRALRALENAKLLVRTKGNGIQLFYKGNFSWIIGGPLQKKFLEEREVKFVRHHLSSLVQSGKINPNCYINSSEYELRPETWKDFVQAVSQTVKEVHDRSAREQPFCKSSDRKQYHWIMVLAPESHVADQDILELR